MRFCSSWLRLTRKRFVELRSIAGQLGLDALVEVHKENAASQNIGQKLIGINNRDLSTLEFSLSTSESLVKTAPANALIISESGLGKRDELQRLQQLGFDGFDRRQPDAIRPIPASPCVSCSSNTCRASLPGHCKQMNVMQIKGAGIYQFAGRAGLRGGGCRYDRPEHRRVRAGFRRRLLLKIIVAAVRPPVGQTKVVGVLWTRAQFVQKVTDVALDAINCMGRDPAIPE